MALQVENEFLTIKRLERTCLHFTVRVGKDRSTSIDESNKLLLTRMHVCALTSIRLLWVPFKFLPLMYLHMLPRSYPSSLDFDLLSWECQIFFVSKKGSK